MFVQTPRSGQIFSFVLYSLLLKFWQRAQNCGQNTHCFICLHYTAALSFLFCFYSLFATKLWSCGQPRQPSSPADIQSGYIIMADALISWPGYTWTLCGTATDSLPGGPGSTRWLIEQFYIYMSPSLLVYLFLSLDTRHSIVWESLLTVCPCCPQNVLYCYLRLLSHQIPFKYLAFKYSLAFGQLNMSYRNYANTQ